MGELAEIGIITTSDRASSGQYEDRGGPAILGFFEEAIKSLSEFIIDVLVMNRK